MSPLSSLGERWASQVGQLTAGEMVPMALVLGLFAVCTAVEQIVPAERGQGWAGRLRNLAYFAIYAGLGLATLALCYALAPTPSDSRGAAATVENLWLVPPYVFAIDFAYYWYHRAQHQLQTLWAIHELHHADAELNVTTSYRTYWLEAPLQAIAVGTPALWLFGKPGIRFALLAMIVSRVTLLFAHCNFRLSLGPLTPLLCGPQWHRIHHSKLAEHRDRNFAQVFPVIDILFGTYYAPAADEYPATGTDGLESTAPIWRALLQPFAIWRGELRRRS